MINNDTATYLVVVETESVNDFILSRTSCILVIERGDGVMGCKHTETESTQSTTQARHLNRTFLRSKECPLV